ncbi:MAG: glycosyltransferase family 2 protein [Candidatus Portnoybacteria bacterium]|nr:glycosyltransferase family 2 protein [Candidatus Portnoybacteria bacterium]
MPYLSVVIPAYNEEKRIAKALLAYDQYLSKQSYDYELIVVDDGSKDKTAEVVSNFQKIVRNLKLIDNKENHGKGWVVKQGMLEAQGEYCMYIDADNAISLDQIEDFWPYLKQGYDIIIGSIEVEGSKIEEHAAWYRRLLGKMAKYLIRALTVWEVHDSQRAFKLFPKNAVNEIFSRQTIERWGFDIEILVLAKKLGYKIKELPVIWINPAESKVSLGSYFNTLRELLKIKWNLIRGKYDLRKKL